MRAWIKSAWVLFQVLLIIAGCSPTKRSSLPTATSMPDTAFPVGAFANGDWFWEFKADGSFVSSGPQGSESGTYSVHGDQVIITCQCCGDVQGTYNWAYDGVGLKFTAVDDKCTNRKDVIDASTWSKKP